MLRCRRRPAGSGRRGFPVQQGGLVRGITIFALAAMLLAACAPPAVPVGPAPLSVGSSAAAIAPALSGGNTVDSAATAAEPSAAVPASMRDETNSVVMSAPPSLGNQTISLIAPVSGTEQITEADPAATAEQSAAGQPPAARPPPSPAATSPATLPPPAAAAAPVAAPPARPQGD